MEARVGGHARCFSVCVVNVGGGEFLQVLLCFGVSFACRVSFPTLFARGDEVVLRRKAKVRAGSQAVQRGRFNLQSWECFRLARDRFLVQFNCVVVCVVAYGEDDGGRWDGDDRLQRDVPRQCPFLFQFLL